MWKLIEVISSSFSHKASIHLHILYGSVYFCFLRVWGIKMNILHSCPQRLHKILTLKQIIEKFIGSIRQLDISTGQQCIEHRHPTHRGCGVPPGGGPPELSHKGWVGMYPTQDIYSLPWILSSAFLDASVSYSYDYGKSRHLKHAGAISVPPLVGFFLIF